MGFGVLFIGYVVTFLFAMTKLSVITNLFGALIMMYALTLLSRYNRFFKYALIASGALTVYGIVYLIFVLFMNSSPEIMETVLTYVKAGIVFLYHIPLLKGISQLAYEVELPKVARKAVRNLSFTIVYFVFEIFTLLPFPQKIAEEINLYVSFPVLCMGLIWLVLNGILLFSCYMWICLEGDEDMEAKESKFEIVNKLTSKVSEIEDRAFHKKKKPVETPKINLTSNNSKSTKKKKKKK